MVLIQQNFIYNVTQSDAIPALSSTIMSSLADDVSASFITEDMNINPRMIIGNVQLRPINSAMLDHQAVLLQTGNTFLINCKLLEDYFKACDLLRPNMLTSNYPSILNEQPTLKFLLREMPSRPDYSGIILKWISIPPSTSKEMQSMAPSVHATIAHVSIQRACFSGSYYNQARQPVTHEDSKNELKNIPRTFSHSMPRLAAFYHT